MRHDDRDTWIEAALSVAGIMLFIVLVLHGVIDWILR